MIKELRVISVNSVSLALALKRLPLEGFYWNIKGLQLSALHMHYAISKQHKLAVCR
jgi:hypothetical protein